MAIGTGAAILGAAGMGVLGSRKASKAQRSANNSSIAEQRRQFDINRADQEPFRKAGVDSLNKLTALLNDPNYMKNITAQGTQGIDRSASARGLYGSGGHLKDLNDYNVQSYTGDYLNRLGSLAGVGQTATNQLNNLGQNYANNVSNLNTASGNSRASSYLGMANSLSNGADQYARYRGYINPGNQFTNPGDYGAYNSGASGLPTYTMG